MATLADMNSRIAAEMSRSNLTTQIASAISDAIAIYQKQRFRFNESNPSVPVTFNTVAGQQVYGAAANANIGTLMGVDYAVAQIGNSLQYVERDRPDHILVFNQLGTMRGQPMWFAYEGNTIRLAPVPDQVYEITIGLFRSLAAPVSDSETDNPWMNDAERLIRSRAKYEIATHVTRNPALAEAMSPTQPPPGKATGHAAWWAFQELKAEANRVTSLGRIRAMQF